MLDLEMQVYGLGTIHEFVNIFFANFNHSSFHVKLLLLLHHKLFKKNLSHTFPLQLLLHSNTSPLLLYFPYSPVVIPHFHYFPISSHFQLRLFLLSSHFFSSSTHPPYPTILTLTFLYHYFSLSLFTSTFFLTFSTPY